MKVIKCPKCHVVLCKGEAKEIEVKCRKCRNLILIKKDKAFIVNQSK